jgi:hypothetical protein
LTFLQTLAAVNPWIWFLIILDIGQNIVVQIWSFNAGWFGTASTGNVWIIKD